MDLRKKNSPPLCIRQKLLLRKLNDFYNEPSNLEQLIPLLTGQSNISLRIIDWFVTNYAKKKFTVFNILKKCKEYNIVTLMGGNISPKSGDFIKKLYKENLLNYIETRNIIIKLDKNNIKNISPAIKSSLIFEAEWLKYKANYYNKLGKEYMDRSNLILSRI